MSNPSPAGPNGSAEPAGRRPGHRGLIAALAGLVLIALFALAALLPVPFIVLSPGPTFNTIGEVEGVALLVVPRVRPVSLAALPSALADFGGSAEMGTTTFATLREYVIGDELRHVHWRSSAKTGKLMMRQYVDVTRPRITLVLVAEERAYTSADEFEEAVDFIASLAAVASSSGLDVEVVTTSGERASHGGGRSSAVLDLLALVEGGASGVDTRLLRSNRATTIVVRGQGVLGWWDRIPALSVMRP